MSRAASPSGGGGRPAALPGEPSWLLLVHPRIRACCLHLDAFSLPALRLCAQPTREAEFAELECRLSEEQTAAYDAASEVWQELRASLAEAVAATASGKDVWKPFWAAQQRFFKLL